jgi:hypothetical protein
MDLNKICDPARPYLSSAEDDATPVRVAQALSRAIDDFQESDGLYLDDGVGHERTMLRVNEVSAELHRHLGGVASFEVKTSDGRTFRVRVAEVPSAPDPTQDRSKFDAFGDPR